MLLTISTTHRPATDLGFLLHKHPGRMQAAELSFGTATILYPVATEELCRVALVLDVDPVALSRRKGRATTLEPYVNDRPYVASSFLSVALSQVFGTALNGRCKQRPELVETPMPLAAELPVVPIRGGEAWARRLFEPLGYTVELERVPLDPHFEEWGASPYYRLALRRTGLLRDLLRHLYVMIPVLDDRKHYWVGEAEVKKLLQKGEGWLGEHAEREEIVRRYLRRSRPLTRLALERLVDPEDDEKEKAREAEKERLEKPLGLHNLRLDRVCEVLVAAGARHVLDLGCGEGKLLQRLLKVRQFERVVGLDASLRSLENAERRLHLEDASPKLRQRVELLHGALTYRDSRLEGYDAAALVEVIEHLDPPRLAALERVVWQYARPSVVVLTTPNREYNVLFSDLPAGRFRHRDHRFEWTREELRDWATGVAERWQYSVRFEALGDEDEHYGAPSQMAVFERCES